MAELTTKPLETLKSQLKDAAEGTIDINEVNYLAKTENRWVNNYLDEVKAGRLPITEMYAAVEKLIIVIKSMR